jgi:hypothetical protein
MKNLLTILLLIGCAGAEPCHKFSIAWQDDLGNVITGFPHGIDTKFQDKLTKKFNVCYDPKSSTVLFLSGRPATYHGVKHSTNEAPISGTVEDANPGSPTYGQTVGTMDGTVQTSSSAPYSVDYKLLYLTIQREVDGKEVVIQSFAGKTLHPTMYGICTHNCHPSEGLIEQAAKWLKANPSD